MLYYQNPPIMLTRIDAILNINLEECRNHPSGFSHAKVEGLELREVIGKQDGGNNE
jgi:hypothetical protein